MIACLMTVLSLLIAVTPAWANSPRLAVFDLEWIDTSLQGEVNGRRADEQDRLMRAGEQLRRDMAGSGGFDVVDIAPVNAAAHERNLQACGGCDVQLAQRLGADLALTGVMQKVSNLILTMSLQLRNAHTGQLVATMSVDLRGNTDETWSRAVNYLVRERLLAPGYGAPQSR